MGRILPFILGLSLVLVICIVAGKPLENDEWWEYGHFYQIYPRSYKDSDGDGVGDLQGIIDRLVHLKNINASGVWLSPIFKSPMKDFGYDISDFRAIDEVFGTMEDFDRLVKRCKELDIKLILDFVPNHSSDQHEWFKASADPNHPEHAKYKDYYLWNEGKVLENGKRAPPSNWLAAFRGSAWEWSDSRQAYYLHQFLAEQPDLNYRNQAVVDEMKEVLRFWLRKGVAGFRCDTVATLFEADVNADGLYDDEPLSGNCVDDPEDQCYLNRILTTDQDETYDMIIQWRKVMDEEEFSDLPRILMTEAYSSVENTQRYYGKVENGKIVEYGSHIPFNFRLITQTFSTSNADDFKSHIGSWVSSMPKGKGVHSNWVLGNHDQKRTASRYGPARTDLLNILLKTLPGITITYSGEEIGMTDVWISWEDTVDPQACRTNPDIYHSRSRDPARTPFQWDSSTNAGFSTAKKTWLPVALNYTDCNVELEESQANSHLKIFRELIALRENPTLKYGGFQLNAIEKDVLVYKREIEGQSDADIYAIVLNLGPKNKVIDLSASLSGIPNQMKVAVTSLDSTGPAVGESVATNEIAVPADVGIVLVGKNQ